MIRTLVHWLMPACAATGSRGLPVPDPVDIAAVIRPSRRNSALAAPADFSAKPDVVTRPYAVPADVLYDAVVRMAAGQERVFLAAAYPTRLQAHFVARGERLNIPDVIAAEAVTLGEGTSALVIYAARVHGWSDFGVNRRRLAGWVAALDAVLNSREVM